MRRTELPFDQDKIPTFFWNHDFNAEDTISGFEQHLERSMGMPPLVTSVA